MYSYGFPFPPAGFLGSAQLLGTMLSSTSILSALEVVWLPLILGSSLQKHGCHA